MYIIRNMPICVYDVHLYLFYVFVCSYLSIIV